MHCVAPILSSLTKIDLLLISFLFTLLQSSLSYLPSNATFHFKRLRAIPQEKEFRNSFKAENVFLAFLLLIKFQYNDQDSLIFFVNNLS